MSAADDGAGNTKKDRQTLFFVSIHHGWGRWVKAICLPAPAWWSDNRSISSTMHLGHHSTRWWLLHSAFVCAVYMCCVYITTLWSPRKSDVVIRVAGLCVCSTSCFCSRVTQHDVQKLRQCGQNKTKIKKKNAHLFLVSLDGFWTSAISSSVVYAPPPPYSLFWKNASSFGRWSDSL